MCAVLAMMLPGLHAQSAVAPAQPAPAAEQPESPQRSSLGFRVLEMPLGRFGVIGRNTYQATTISNKTAYDWQFNTTSRSPGVGLGVSYEYVLGPRSVLTADLMFHRLRYDSVTDIYWGTDDATTSTDERSRMTRTERTKARLWDLPVLLHYGGFRKGGAGSRFYVAGGVAFRLVTNVRTRNDISYSNGTSEVNYDTAQPARRHTFGGVAGIGFRFIDDFNIKVTPEIRYTRWIRSVFSADSTQSPKNQIEIGFGLTF
jgi:hypothetical protein